jgi:SAM-dependent methyltransferase
MTETERPSALTGHTHVREAEDFDSVYMQGVPPWDIGRSQPAFAELAERGLVAGRVLDAGCGTGEHTLMAAALGLEATGFDVAATAIAIANTKARDRGLEARFLQLNALVLSSLGEQFDTGPRLRALPLVRGRRRPPEVRERTSRLDAGRWALLHALFQRPPGW